MRSTNQGSEERSRHGYRISPGLDFRTTPPTQLVGHSYSAFPIFFGPLVPLTVQNPMNSEERIRALSMKVAAASDNSEEFRAAMSELRAALNENARRARNKTAALRQKAFPDSAPDDPGSK